jgi:hypothetical protein
MQITSIELSIDLAFECALIWLKTRLALCCTLLASQFAIAISTINA